MKINLIFGLILLLLHSCSSPEPKNVQAPVETDPKVKSQLQGVWLDKNTEAPVLRIEGDSICYISKIDVRMAYKLVGDTLFVSGLHTSAYPILHRTEHTLRFKTPLGDVMSLYKNENENLVIPQAQPEEKPAVRNRIQKDSVISYRNIRYRGYAYINPTTMKVIRPGVTEDGFFIDNVYYDNIIHICVYQGKNRLCGKDIAKQAFESVIPADFLEVAILEDMEFIKVTDEDFIYRATLCVPDGPCYYANVLINRKSEVRVKLIQ